MEVRSDLRKRPLLVAANFPRSVLTVVMSAWLPWITAVAVLVVLPIALRLYVGDDPPNNEIAQEQGGGEGSEPAPEALPSLAVRLAA